MSRGPILVTGGAGFIGSHLVERLLEKECHVRVLARTNSGQSLGHLDSVPKESRSRLEVVWGDIRDPDAARDAVHGVEAVFHLAALISIPYSYLRPRETAEVNVMGTLNIARAAARAGIRLFVHTSTSEVLGSARVIPMDESHPLSPQSPYAASKAGADHMIAAMVRSENLPAVTLRPFNTFGPRQSARAVIPLVLSQVLSSNRIRIGSLEPKRDFTFVTDTVAAYIALLELPTPPIGELFHVGSGKAISIGDLIARAQSMLGTGLPLEQAESRIRPSASEVVHLEANMSRFRTATGWEPSVSLDDGLRKTADWLRARPDRMAEALRAL